ncbi:MAG: phosphotransferase [Anaerolineae bacterium]|nr:phosphotransferase [Anaerolineae bacterium]
MQVLRPGTIRRQVGTYLVSLRTGEAAVQDVLAKYDVGNPMRCRRSAGGQRSQTWLISTDRGRYALKQYPDTLDVLAVEFEHALLEYLQQARFPAPHLVHTRQGKTWLVQDGKLYACFEFLNGFRYSDYFFFPSSSQARYLVQAAQMLAEYHRLVADFVPPGRKVDGFKAYSRQRWHGKEWYLEEMEACREALENHLAEHEWWTRWTGIRSRLATLWDELEGMDAAPIPALPIHGDYGPYNLLYRNGQLTAVLDFECAHLDWRLTEVMSATVRFASRRGGGLDVFRARQFLRAYNDVNPLTTEERRVAPQLFELSRLRNLIKALIRFREQGTASSLATVGRMLAWADQAAIWEPLLKEIVG